MTNQSNAEKRLPQNRGSLFWQRRGNASYLKDRSALTPIPIRILYSSSAYIGRILSNLKYTINTQVTYNVRPITELVPKGYAVKRVSCRKINEVINICYG